MSYGHEFHAPLMSPFFCPHQPFDDITLDDIRPYFPPPRYPTDGQFDSDTRLMLTVSLDSNPSEPSYPNYHAESNLSKPSYPSVIRLTSDSSSSSAAPRHIPPPVRARGFIHTRAVPSGCGRGREGEHSDDAPGGFGNDYLPFDG